MSLAGRKRILCLDFDGVCHSYVSGWKGATVIPDAPVPGLLEFLVQAVEVFEVNIFSSRSGQGGIPAMRQWFIDEAEVFHPHWTGCMPKDKAIEWVDDNLKFPTEKPPAFVGIDDRVITFTGKWPSIAELGNFKPWNQLGVSGERVETAPQIVKYADFDINVMNEIRIRAEQGHDINCNDFLYVMRELCNHIQREACGVSGEKAS